MVRGSARDPVPVGPDDDTPRDTSWWATSYADVDNTSQTYRVPDIRVDIIRVLDRRTLNIPTTGES